MNIKGGQWRKEITYVQDNIYIRKRWLILQSTSSRRWKTHSSDNHKLTESIWRIVLKVWIQALHFRFMIHEYLHTPGRDWYLYGHMLRAHSALAHALRAHSALAHALRAHSALTPLLSSHPRVFLIPSPAFVSPGDMIVWTQKVTRLL